MFLNALHCNGGVLKQIYLRNELQLMKMKPINLRLGEWMFLLKQISLKRAPAVVEAADSCFPQNSLSSLSNVNPMNYLTHIWDNLEE